jgi:Derlin-2/3
MRWHPSDRSPLPSLPLCRGRYGAAYEDNPFPSGGGPHRGSIADFVWMLVFGALVLLPLSWFFGGIPFMASSMLFMVIYTWSVRNPGAMTSFYGFSFQASYLPWVLVGFTLLVGDDPLFDLMGIAAGHLYYVIQETLPEADTPLKGYRLWQTPQWLARLFKVAPTNAAAFYMNDAARRAAQQNGERRGGHNWGQGQVLGGR